VIICWGKEDVRREMAKPVLINRVSIKISCDSSLYYHSEEDPLSLRNVLVKQLVYAEFDLRFGRQIVIFLPVSRLGTASGVAPATICLRSLSLEGLPFNNSCLRSRGHMLALDLLLERIELFSELVVDLFVVDNDSVHGVLLHVPKSQFLVEQLDRLFLLLIQPCFFLLGRAKYTSSFTL
jgi:hypothetical protein